MKIVQIMILCCVMGVYWALPAAAQPSASGWMAATKLAPDLVFPDKPSSFSFFSTPEMALYKPDGAGPFPAVVIQHQCGGLRSSNWMNLSILQWAKTAVAHGYVALVIDSLGPRGAKTVCLGPQAGVNFPRGVRDTLQAAEHLRKFDFVDKQRIALAGYSWGAMSATMGSSKFFGNALAAGERFAAAVAFYPGCSSIKPATGTPYEIVNDDIDRPLLVLMGALDNETPPGECTSRLQVAKDKGAPVQWHTYPEATHCWDCKNLHNFSKVDGRGSQVAYKYDEAITKDSEKRMFEFLDRAMGVPR